MPAACTRSHRRLLALDPLLAALIRPQLRRVATATAWAAVLAAASAAYGALVGPLLRALFGGERLVWPAALAAHLPPPPDVETLRVALPVLLVAAAAVKGLAGWRHATSATLLGQAIVRDLRGRLHDRLLALPPDQVAALGAADLQSRITQDVRSVEAMAVEGLAARVRDGAQVVALLGLCVVIEWRMALLVLATYPIFLVPAARLGRALRRAAGRIHADRGRLAVVLDDQMRRLPLLQMSGERVGASQAFAEAADTLATAEVRATTLRALSSPLNEVVGALVLAATLVHAGQRIEAGTLAAEHVLSFFVAVLLLYQPVKGLVRSQALIEPGRAALARAQALLDLPAHIPSGPGRAPPTAPPTLRLRGISADRGGQPVLHAVDADLPGGRLTALVGPNGAGKTTLAWLLARLVEPTAGTVDVDGVPLPALDADAWRQRVGWVTQAPLLGRGTLRAHLGPAGAQLDAEALATLATRAGLDTVLARLPTGWDTELGDGGAGLSGGEQQRLALARALVRSPVLLVLDEPTAHLDAAAAQGLRTTLAGLRGLCTVLLITHDAELAAGADTTVRLDHGRVV